MRRVIVDYKKLTTNILDLLVEKFPDGYGDSDIISFKNQAGELKNDFYRLTFFFTYFFGYETCDCRL